MKCPFCHGEESKVIDSREFGDTIKRRRECLSCKKRFTTYERVEAKSLYVIKKDKSREKFDREKILRGLTIATSKRNISRDTLEEFVMQIEKKLQSSVDSEISTQDLGEFVMRELKSLDEVAYVRFVSVYKAFDDIKSFIEIVENIQNNDNKEL